ncbi:adenylosuccinate lyase [Aquimarina brevivitae]|uniref:Adenylosuccinate lyase n=1 Tax=Aquimarina brevivitae TaxID=323412 RepID=A0A4Q7P114_9FLAO|nr:adenylosuccinate lyase [Aquimarina brevivitae]RZS93506.1 hypothetical protein EV197_2085 [Aquimarina brevivitae]
MSSFIEIQLLETLNHSRAKRNEVAEYLLRHPESIPDVIDICGKIDEDISCKAAWVLEFVCGKDLSVLLPHINAFLSCAKLVYQDPAVRPMAKICEYLTYAYYKQKTTTLNLTLAQKEKMVALCFDWLITSQKVAAKAYAMTSLYLLGNDVEWVHPELKLLLLQNYDKGSAAYKARARKVLKELT